MNAAARRPPVHARLTPPVSLLLGAIGLTPWAVPAANAQDVIALSLEEAMRLASDESEEIVVAQAGVLRADGQELQARSEFWPQVVAGIAYQHTFASEFDQAFEQQQPQQPPPDGEGDDGAGDTLPFGQKHYWRIDLLSVTQTLYAGGRVRAQARIADAGEESAALDLVMARAATVLEAAEAYYDVLLAERLVDIAAEAVAQAGRLHEQARVGFDVGAQPEFDVLRAQVEVDNQQVELVRARRQLQVATLRLHQLLDIPGDLRLTLTTPLAVGGDREARAVEIAEVPPQLTVDLRAPVRQARTVVDMRAGSLRVARSQWLPLVQAGGYLGFASYPEELIPSFESWQDVAWASVSLQMPLFTGFRIRGEVKEARADLLESEAELLLASELATFDSASILADLAEARATWEATSGTVDVARRSYEIAEVRYGEGLGPQIDVTDARLQLQQALANQAQATRDLLVARLQLALLPALPLQTTGVAPTLLAPTPEESAFERPASRRGELGASDPATTRPTTQMTP